MKAKIASDDAIVYIAESIKLYFAKVTRALTK